MMPFEPKFRPPQLTPKQIRILKALIKRNPDGTLLDVYELIDRVAPGTARGGMRCSLRHMVTHGLIKDGGMKLVNGRWKQTFEATPRGATIVRPGYINTAGNP